MKKIIKISLIFLIFLMILLSCKSLAATGVVTGKSVRLRKEATTESEILITLKKDEQVEIIGEIEGWYNINFKDKTGYASKDYVKILEEDVQVDNSSNDVLNTENNQPTTSEKLEINIGQEYTLNKNTKIRLKPNFSSIVLAELNIGDKIVVEKVLGNWVKIAGQNNGWICLYSIKINEQEEVEQEPTEEVETENQEEVEQKPEENEPVNQEKPEEQIATPNEENKPEEVAPTFTIGYVNAETVNVRQGPSTDTKRLGFLDLNDEVEILSEQGDWYKINTKEYGECYIAKRLISPTKVASRGEENPRDTTISVEKNEELNEILNTSNTSQIVDFAKQYLGYSYVSGGKKPETGFDCSGFTRYVYSNFGISLGATAASQANNSGNEVSRQELQPGDLILFQDDAKTKIGHCGIYIGDNLFIHAANPKRGVVTDKLEGNSYYSPRYVSAYRF